MLAYYINDYRSLFSSPLTRNPKVTHRDLFSSETQSNESRSQSVRSIGSNKEATESQRLDTPGKIAGTIKKKMSENMYNEKEQTV